jgi:DNA polymerase-3 subunit alpha
MKTFDVFCEGQTLGIFQFESSGMRQILRQARPRKFEDLIALNALYRPGPIKGGMIDDFVNRKHGRVEVKYELEQLRPILDDTYGVMAYQEQVMRVASELAGFTLGEADLLRKAMGKKNRAHAGPARSSWRATGRGISAKKAARVFDLMEQFAAGSTSRTDGLRPAAPHRVSEGQLPVALHGGAADHRSQNTAKLASYLHECRELRVPILAPDINSSELAFTVRPEGVRFGLGP